MKQASHKVTVLLESSGIDPFLEDLAKGADRVFYFEEGSRDTPRLTAKTWLKMKGLFDDSTATIKIFGDVA